MKILGISIKPSYKIKFNTLILFAAFFLVLIYMAVISLQSYYAAVDYIMGKVENINMSSVNQAKRNLENQIDQIKSITQNLSTNQALIHYMEKYEWESGAEKTNSKGRIEAFLAKMMKFNTNIKAIVVITKKDVIYFGKGPFYGLNSETIKNSKFKNILDNTGELILIEPMKTIIKSNNSGNMDMLLGSYSFASNISIGTKNYGTLFVLLNDNIFDNVYKHNTNLLLLDNSGRLIWRGSGISENQAVFAEDGMSVENGQQIHKGSNSEAHFYSIDLKYNDWILVYVHKKSDFAERIAIIRYFFILGFLIIVFLSYILSRVVSSNITNPLNKLVILIREFRVKSGKAQFYRENTRRKSTLRESILFYFLCVIVLPISLYTVLTFILYSNMIEEYIIETNQAVFKQTEENINFFIQSKEKVGESIIYDEIIQDALKKQPGENFTNDMNEMIHRNLLLQEGKDDIYVYDSNNKLLYSNDIYLEAGTNGQYAKKIDQKSMEKIMLWENEMDSYKRPLLILMMKINDLDTYKMIGHTRFIILEYQLENIYKNIAKDYIDIFITDSQNKIISHPDKTRINTVYQYPSGQTYNKTDYMEDNTSFLFKTPLSNGNWYLVGCYSRSIFEKDIKNFFYEKVYILIIVFFLTTVIAFFLSLRLSTSFRNMNDILAEFTVKNLKTVFSEESNINEISELGYAFNQMIQRTESLTDQLLESKQKQHELENQKKDAEMISLQSQINPHFLYNTFESINWLIKRERKQDATKMIKLLSDMFRFVAKTDNLILSLGEELKYTNAYVDIMKMRFQDNLNLRFISESELLACKTIKLILQPIVENAIYHGIAPKQAAGTIIVACKRLDNVIHICISDDGVGIEKKKLDTLNDQLNKDMYEGRIGIYNVQTRIRLFFGMNYGLKIYSVYGAGTTVEVTIPALD